MDVSAAAQNQIASVQQAIGMATMQKSMNQDAATVNKLLEGMEETSKAVNKASESHKGNNIDVMA